jgi:hypothetical protein
LFLAQLSYKLLLQNRATIFKIKQCAALNFGKKVINLKNGNLSDKLIPILGILILIGLSAWGIIAMKSNGYTFNDVLEWIASAAGWGVGIWVVFGIAVTLLIPLLLRLLFMLRIMLVFFGVVFLISGYTIASVICFVLAGIISVVLYIRDDELD